MPPDEALLLCPFCCLQSQSHALCPIYLSLTISAFLCPNCSLRFADAAVCRPLHRPGARAQMIQAKLLRCNIFGC